MEHRARIRVCGIAEKQVPERAIAKVLRSEARKAKKYVERKRVDRFDKFLVFRRIFVGRLQQGQLAPTLDESISKGTISLSQAFENHEDIAVRSRIFVSI